MTLRRRFYALMTGCLLLSSEVDAGRQNEIGRGLDERFFQLTKRIDFNERPLGNFEDTPMYWVQLTGEGLPRYSNGRFDFEIGHDAPPSFRFTMRGGNTVYEYQNRDLRVLPDSDYLVVAFVQTRHLEHARAFLAAYLVDRFGQVIEGSRHISAVVPQLHGDEPAAEPWRRLEVAVPGLHADAHAMRIQFWVLQDHAWRKPAPEAIDPIEREEVCGEVWFDDLAVYRVPRIRLRLSNPSGFVTHDAAGALLLDVQNATENTLQTRLNVTNASGESVFRFQASIPPNSSEPVVAPLPPLPPGNYTADASVFANDQLVLQRHITFASFAPLPPGPAPMADVGVNLGTWRGGDIDALLTALRALNVGAAKFGVSLHPKPLGPDALRYLDEVRRLSAGMLGRQIDPCGVLLNGIDLEETSTPASAPAVANPFETLYGASLMEFGGALTTWQWNGVEQPEAPPWARVREAFLKHIAAPTIVQSHEAITLGDASDVLHAVLGEDGYTVAPLRTTTASRASEGQEILNVTIPHFVPAYAMVWQLAPFGAAGAAFAPSRFPPWVEFTFDADAETTTEERVTDLAQRIILARAVGAARTYVPVPLMIQDAGGESAWMPTEAAHAVRTLYRFLSGKAAVRVLRFADDALGVLFSGRGEDCLVFWTWAAPEREIATPLYLGSDVRVLDLYGQTEPLRTIGDRAYLKASRSPRIAIGIDLPLVMLQSYVQMEPRRVDAGEPETTLTLTLRNPYPTVIRGLVSLETPRDWRASPNSMSFSLRPEEDFDQPIVVSLPPGQEAARAPLRLTLTLHEPSEKSLEFDVPIQLGLRDVYVDVEAYWEQDVLVVRQTLRNDSRSPVSFSTHCQAPARPRLDGAFLDVPANQTRVQTYSFRAAAALVGQKVAIGLEEIGGRRTLLHVLMVPPQP